MLMRELCGRYPLRWYDLGMSGTTSVEVGDRGRIVIPVRVREQLHLRPGTVLVVRVEDGALILESQESLKAKLHAMFADLPESMADRLSRERRAEAERENAP